MSIYEENGYRTRSEYLEALSNEFCLHYSVVVSLAEMLGESEDFNGLVLALEDEF